MIKPTDIHITNLHGYDVYLRASLPLTYRFIHRETGTFAFWVKAESLDIAATTRLHDTVTVFKSAGIDHEIGIALLHFCQTHYALLS